MATPYSFINPRMQTYQGLKSSVSLAGKSLAKFDTLNAHIRDSVVLAGELVIIGDYSTKACTAQEAYLMRKATEVHHMLLINGMEGDSYVLDNYDFLQDVIDRTSIATGVVSDGWSRHLKSIESSPGRNQRPVQKPYVLGETPEPRTLLPETRTAGSQHPKATQQRCQHRLGTRQKHPHQRHVGPVDQKLFETPRNRTLRRHRCGRRKSRNHHQTRRIHRRRAGCGVYVAGDQRGLSCGR
jgi:hypothetical protein